MLKRYKNPAICFYSLFVIAMAVAVFYDLALDIWLNNPGNLFAIWLRNTGEIPSRLICPLAGTVIFFAASGRWEKAAGFLLSIGGSAYFGYYFGKYFFVEEHRMLFSILWGVGFGIVALLIGSLIPRELMQKLRAAAWIGVVVMTAQLLCIEGLKYLWGRVRFRDLLAAGNYDAFTSWLHPNGINGNKSFPSGHTAGAGMSYLMMLLPLYTDRFKGKGAALLSTSIHLYISRGLLAPHYGRALPQRCGNGRGDQLLPRASCTEAFQKNRSCKQIIRCFL